MRVRVRPRLIEIIIAIVLACSLAFTSCAGEEGNKMLSHARLRREVFQSKYTELPEINVNTKFQDVGFNSVNLERTIIQIEGYSYYALRFKTPDLVGQLVWSFRVPDSEGAFGWYIVPASGKMQGFTSYMTYRLPEDIKDLGTKGDAFILQRLPGRNLKPNNDYIMWFGFEKRHRAQVLLSLNVFPETSRIAYRVVFPMFYQETNETTDSNDKE